MASPVRRAMLLLVLLCLASAGCASGDRGDRTTGPTQSGLLVDAAEAADLGYRINWVQNLDVSREQRVVSAQILGDLLVTVEQPRNVVTAISLRNGDVAWRRVVGTRAESLFPPARSGETILINSNSRLFRLRARSGDVLSVTDLPRIASTGPHTNDTLTYFGSIDGTIYGLDLTNGVVQWSYGLSDVISAPIVASDGAVIAADAAGNIALLDAEEGRLRWRERAFAAITAAPALDEDRLAFIPSQDGSLYAIERATGSDRWVYRSSRPLSTSPEVYGDVIVQAVPGRGVVGLAADGDGEPLWQVSEVNARPVTARDGSAVLASPQKLLRVDLQSGDVLDTAPTQTLQTVLAGPDGSLIALSPGGRIMRLNAIQQ